MSEARDIEIERILRDLVEEHARTGERLRSLLQVYLADRKATGSHQESVSTEVARIRAEVGEVRALAARLVAEREASPGFWAPFARLIAAGGWPAVVLVTSPLVLLAATGLIWAAVATDTPLPALILALFGGIHAPVHP